MAMFTSSISKPSVSAGFALKSLSVVAIATLGMFAAPAAQAAIISGQVIGIWEITVGALNEGDAFTADYTYDSESFTTVTDFSNEQYDRYLIQQAPLLSMVLKSGGFIRDFNLGAKLLRI